MTKRDIARRLPRANDGNSFDSDFEDKLFGVALPPTSEGPTSLVAS